MNDKVSKKEIYLSATIFVAMIGFLIYGFVGLGAGKLDNCWDKYATEQEAIMNCEGQNK